MPCRSLFLIVSLTVVASCCELRAQLAPADVPRAELLRAHIASLGRSVRRDEAGRVAECAYTTAQRLRRNYGAVWPPSFQNLLVNTGIRKRGLCYQWAEDLLEQLDALKVTTLELHWAEAYAGTGREHNCIVVTARGQPVRDGILLDCWRHSGHLFWSVVAADHYPWVEDSEYAATVRSKSVEKRNSRLAEGHSRSANDEGSTVTASTR